VASEGKGDVGVEGAICCWGLMSISKIGLYMPVYASFNCMPCFVAL
jgi:hypothetical protein